MNAKIDERIIEHFSPITDEERTLLKGSEGIERSLYMQGGNGVINAKKLLDSGKLITIRPHTRFVHFPTHTHDYVEVVYMCSGKSTHIVGGKRIELTAGELLFLSQSATHEIERAEEDDIAINFIVLPDFFSASLSALGEEETPLRRFLVDCLTQGQDGPGYLHFLVSEVKPIQNLVENLLWTLIEDSPMRRSILQTTMTLLFLQLLSHTDSLASDTKEDEALFTVLRYIEANYTSATLSEAADLLHYNAAWLSREIKRKTGLTFTELVQKKRLAQAAFLLGSTKRRVSDISFAVGYENVSYFHRIFFDAYGISPKHYRDAREDTFLQK